MVVLPGSASQPVKKECRAMGEDRGVRRILIRLTGLIFGRNLVRQESTTRPVRRSGDALRRPFNSVLTFGLCGASLRSPSTTNVLIYALDEADLKKQSAARVWRAELWKTRRGRISFQVLQEFCVKVTRKWPGARREARAEVRDLLAWRPVTMDEKTVERSWRIQDRYQLSFGDAMIVAAAKAASCRYLLTEDLQAGQDLDGLVVVSPFLDDPGSLPKDPLSYTHLESGCRSSSTSLSLNGHLYGD